MQVEVWGLASGRNSTEGAARGAFTTRTYLTEEAAKLAKQQGDWLDIISEMKKEATT